MSSFFGKVSSSFDTYYAGLLEECSYSSKAKKDIVGRHYESWKTNWIKSYVNLDVATSEEVIHLKKEYDGVFDADIYIVDAQTRELLAFEEAKGHYVDKCFLKRALSNATEVTTIAIMKGFRVPHFVLSCPTNYSKASKILEFSGNYLQPKIYESLKNKFAYFPLCDHGRVSRGKYLKKAENPFVLSESLCYNQHDFYANLGN